MIPNRTTTIHLIVVLGLFTAGCEDHAGHATQAAGSRPPAEFGEMPPEVAACGTVEPSSGTLSQTWALPPASEHSSARDSIIAAFDIATGEDGTLYIIDREIARATAVRESGMIHFGRSGKGPGEFTNPGAIAAHNGKIYIAESGRIHVFTADGKIQNAKWTSMGGIDDIAVLGNGKLVLARNVSTMSLAQDSSASTYVALADSTGEVKSAVLQVKLGQTHRRPLVAPVINPVAVSAGRNAFAVWYPFDNYVQVFDVDGRVLYTYDGCLPSQLESYYKKSSTKARYQNARAMTLGVSVSNDNSLIVATWDRSQAGRAIRITRVDNTGQEVSSVKASIQGDDMFNRLVFADPQTMIAHTIVPGMGLRRWTLAR